MQGAFGIVVVVVSVLALIVAVAALATSRGAYDRIGRGELAVDDAGGPAEEVEDLRQLLQATSAHRVARGEPALDVEAELRKRLREM